MTVIKENTELDAATAHECANVIAEAQLERIKELLSKLPELGKNPHHHWSSVENLVALNRRLSKVIGFLEGCQPLLATSAGENLQRSRRA